MSKQTQVETNYGRGDPIDHCGICTFYQGGRCSQVMGAISGYGICDLYKRTQNPFGSTLSPNEVQAIKAMAADAQDRSQGGGAPQPPPPQQPMMQRG